MLSYCLKCRENTESKNQKFVKTKNGRLMVSSNCTFVVVKNQNFFVFLGVKTPLNKICKFDYIFLKGIK